VTAKRDRPGFERLYREHKDHVFSYLARLTSDRELARDVTQQTFLKAWNDPATASLDSPKAYLFTVARNTLYDEWKRKKEVLLAEGEEERVRNMSDDPMESPHEHAASREMRNNIEAAIGLMRPRYRELMLLRYGEDLSIEEIAQVTGRGVSDVKVNLHRARLAFDKDFTALMYSRVARTRGKCEKMTTLLAPFEDSEMPAEQIKVVDQHLVACKLCAEDAGEMKKRRELFIALPLIPAPFALDQAIKQALVPGAKSTAAASGAKTATSGAAAKIVAAVGVAAVLAGGGHYVTKHRAAVAPADPPRTAIPERPAPNEQPPVATETRSATGESVAAVGNVRLQARAAPGGPVLGNDVYWSIYAKDPATGKRKNVASGNGATPTFKVPAGRYIVYAHMNQGTVSAEREIVVEAGKTSEPIELILGFGEIRLAARLAPQSPILTSGVSWTIYMRDPRTGQPRNAAVDMTSTTTLKVPSGRYIAQASMNQGRVRAEREVVIEAGKITDQRDFVINAGTLELRTVRVAGAGGVRTGWSVSEISDGKRRSVIAFPQTTRASTVLNAGRYVVSLSNGAKVTEREVIVIAGQTIRVELDPP